jgi:hypothetical protein
MFEIPRQPRSLAFFVPLAMLLALAASLGCRRMNGSLLVTVRFENEPVIKCVTVSLSAARGSVQSSAPVNRGDRDQLLFGISQTEEIFGELSVSAKAYLLEGCLGTPVSVQTTKTKLEFNVQERLDFLFSGPSPDGGTDAGRPVDGGADCEVSACLTPPECRTTPAACDVDGGCLWSFQPSGTPCSDGGVCSGAGQCSTGVCQFLAAGTACDDGLVCTQGDRCASNLCAGTCGDGGTPACQKQVPGACSTTNSSQCAFEPAYTDQACGNAGRCLAGGCVPWFKLPPSHLPNTVVGLNLVSESANWTLGRDGGPCLSIVDTSPAVLAPRPSSWCGALPLPNGEIRRLADGGEFALFTLSNLNVATKTELRFVGPRPVVLLVLGDATIDGVVSVAPSGADPAAGAPSTACLPAPSGTSASGGGAGGSFGFPAGGNGGDGLGLSGSGAIAHSAVSSGASIP